MRDKFEERERKRKREIEKKILHEYTRKYELTGIRAVPKKREQAGKYGVDYPKDLDYMRMKIFTVRFRFFFFLQTCQ